MRSKRAQGGLREAVIAASLHDASNKKDGGLHLRLIRPTGSIRATLAEEGCSGQRATSKD
jgi:hypothetical protein